jgi:hypothetical protein
MRVCVSFVVYSKPFTKEEPSTDSNASRLWSQSAVGNSPLILDESPFRRIRQYLEPHFVVQTFDEFSEMEIRPKLGVSCRRLVSMLVCVSFVVYSKPFTKEEPSADSNASLQ